LTQLRAPRQSRGVSRARSGADRFAPARNLLLPGLMAAGLGVGAGFAQSALVAGIDALLPREVLRQAFATGLLQDGQLWIDMLEQRNLMAHTYDVHRAQQALAMIRDRFAPALLAQAADLEQRP